MSSPIVYLSGDLTLDTADILVNTVNTRTARMGKGIAKVFATRWPAILPGYEQACRTKALYAWWLHPFRFYRLLGWRPVGYQLIWFLAARLMPRGVFRQHARRNRPR